MATKKILHDLDLQLVSELKNARVHNVTSGDLTSLAGSLGAAYLRSSGIPLAS